MGGGLEEKRRMYVEKISLDLEEEKEVGNAIRMLRIISARTLDKDEEMCVCAS